MLSSLSVSLSPVMAVVTAFGLFVALWGSGSAPPRKQRAVQIA